MSETLFDLRKVTFFSQFSPEALARVAALLKPRTLASGELLFNKGDAGDELILIERGRVAIFMPIEGEPAGTEQAIRIFQSGDMLGEMALVDQKPRSASARAQTETLIWVLKAGDFRALLMSDPTIGLGVMTSLSDRVRYTTDFLGEVRQWVRRMADGNYQTATIGVDANYQDPTLSVLAAEFARMAAQVRQREEELKQELAQLRIEINDAKRKQEVKEIVDSEYYQDLKAKIRRMREENEDDD